MPNRVDPARPRPRLRLAVLAAVSTLALCSSMLEASPVAAQATVAFAFTGGGYGHGVGMSQYGARGRADAGQTAAQILGFYYPGTAIQSIGQPAVRVKLGDTASLTLSGPVLNIGPDGSTSLVTGGGQAATFTASANGTITASLAGGGAADIVGPGGTAAITWNDGEAVAASSFGHQYRHGRIVLRSLSAGTLEVVLDQLPMQQYLDGLGEVPSSWPTESLRAQAIAGRSYAAYRLAHPQSASRFDLYASTSDQAYVGADKASAAYGASWTQAVADTNDQVVTWGGVAIQAFYSSSNGGYTEASSYVFVANLPYLQANPDPYDQAAGNSNFAWTENYNGDELASWLTAAGRPNVGSITGLSVTGGTGASGRVDRATVAVQGASGGSYTLTGTQLRTAINNGAPSSRDLLSTKFAIGGPGPVGGNAIGSNEIAVPWGDAAAIVVGWAADPDVMRDAIAVHVYVNGQFATAVTANRPRPELAFWLPAYGADHGWAAAVWASGRSAQICAFAINQGAGAATTALGCRVITRPPPPPPKKAKTKVKARTTRR